MSDDAAGLLYETRRETHGFNIASVGLSEPGWITIEAHQDQGVWRKLNLNFKAARALAYKLLALAGEGE